MDNSATPELQTSLQIPIDLFVSKQHRRSGDLRFTDASDNLIFSVHSQATDSTSPHRKRLLLDASGNPLITICRNNNDSWQGFRGPADTEEGLIFKVERTLNTISRTEFEVFPVGENLEDSKSGLKMKGRPFRRSCTIYRGNSIVAQGFRLHLNGSNRLRYVPQGGSQCHAPDFLHNTAKELKIESETRVPTEIIHCPSQFSVLIVPFTSQNGVVCYFMKSPPFSEKMSVPEFTLLITMTKDA